MTKKINFRLKPIKNDEVATDITKKLWPYNVYEVMAPRFEYGDVFSQIFLRLLVIENKANGRELNSFNSTEVNAVKEYLQKNLGNIFVHDLTEKVHAHIKFDNLTDGKVDDKTMQSLLKTYQESETLTKQLIFQDAITGEIVPLLPDTFNIDLDREHVSELAIDIKPLELGFPKILDLRKAQKQATRLYRNISKSETYSEEDFEEAFEIELEEEDFSIYLDDDIDSFEQNEKKDTPRYEKESSLIYLGVRECVFLEFIAFYNEALERVQFTSPFNQETDLWFERQVYRSNALSEPVQRFLSEVELLENKHKEAREEKINNLRNKPRDSISDPLLDAICQSKTFKPLEEYYERNLSTRSHESLSVFNTLGVAFEGLLLIIIKRSRNVEKLLALRDKTYKVFKDRIMRQFVFHGIDCPRSLITKTAYDNWKDVVQGKDLKNQVLISRFLAVILDSLYDYQSNFILRINEKKPDYIRTFKRLNWLRNTGSHYTSEISFNIDEEAKTFKNFMITLINYYDKGDSDGEE